MQLLVFGDQIIREYLVSVYSYCIASNYGPGIYFFAAIFNQATTQDRCLLSEETRVIYI